MKFHKYHALGNDYIVLDPKEFSRALTPDTIQRICHRNFGIGSDGILLGPLSTDSPEFMAVAEKVKNTNSSVKTTGNAECALRIFNPDGSEAEKSGNGLRIFARYLLDCGQVKCDCPFAVLTLGGAVTAKLFNEGQQVRVDMGRVGFNADDIPVTGYAGEMINREINIGDKIVLFNAATIGNPHCVIINPDASAEMARCLGPLLETNIAFPQRTNVQFMKIIDTHTIAIEIWERGAGYTLASGSSASACAAVSRRLGLTESPVLVHMPGGTLIIDISEHYDITMQGAVTRVADGTIHPDMLI